MRVVIKVLYIIILNVFLLLSGFNLAIGEYSKYESGRLVTKGDEFFQNQNWASAIWCYQKAIETNDLNRFERLKLNFKIATTYYKKLKKYKKALKYYKYLLSESNLIKFFAKRKVSFLSQDKDEDGIIYAIEHDIGLSDNVPIEQEGNRLLPKTSALKYVHRLGFSGEEISYTLIQKGNDIKITKEGTNKVLKINSQDFIKFWIKIKTSSLWDYRADSLGIKNIYSPFGHEVETTLIRDAESIELFISEENNNSRWLINVPRLAPDDLREAVDIIKFFLEGK